MTPPNREAVEAATLAYGEARMRFHTGAPDPLGPIVALAALPFLAPQPSQSDLARATEFAIELHDEYADNDVRNLAAQFAAVRAEATLAGAVAEREACAKIIDPAASGNAASSMMWNERYALMIAIRARE